MYKVVEFEDNAVGIVKEGWLTPRKKECFWPPYKIPSKFNKCLVSQDLPDENWSIFAIKRIMYDTDDLKSAREKCKKAESESDLVSDTSEQTKKRKKRKPINIISSDNEDEEDVNYIKFKYPDPPKSEQTSEKKKKKTLSTEVIVEEKERADSPQQDLVQAPKSPALYGKPFEPENRTSTILTDSRKELNLYSPSNAQTSKARSLLQNFNVDAPSSSRSLCTTPTETKLSAVTLKCCMEKNFLCTIFITFYI